MKPFSFFFLFSTCKLDREFKELKKKFSLVFQMIEKSVKELFFFPPTTEEETKEGSRINLDREK